MLKNIVLFLLISMYNFVFTQESLIYRLQDSTKSESGWYLGESTDGNFSIELPITFNDFTIKADNFNMYVIGSKSIENIKFSVSEMKNKTLFHEINLDEIINDLDDSTSRISNITKDDQQNYKSVYFEMNSDETASFMKYVYYKDRLYTMIIEYPLTQTDLVLTIKDYFFNSFKILDKKTTIYELH